MIPKPPGSPHAGFEPVDGSRHILFLLEPLDIGACVFEAGYYFATPYEDLEGPFITYEETVEAMRNFVA